eukprot:TRINITY_DN46766_c0_g1_i1.p1 TRINITY_DN46766_c0_g1~~TRINITY_DN46766_c0_g1_i1.p1  ORF type:complete len:271 (+),score=27.12 TRINITY_DN46766_c0_g1_i1:42-854(+)
MRVEPCHRMWRHAVSRGAGLRWCSGGAPQPSADISGTKILDSLASVQDLRRREMKVASSFIHKLRTHLSHTYGIQTPRTSPRDCSMYETMARVAVLAPADNPVTVDGVSAWAAQFEKSHVDVEAIQVLEAHGRAGYLQSHEPMEVRPIASTPVCALSDLEDERVKAIDIEQRPTGLLLISRSGIVSCYANRCPHVGLTLGDELSPPWCPENRLIKCTAHDALFEPGTGQCVHGPAQAPLTMVPFAIENGMVTLRTPTLADLLARMFASPS